MTIISTRNLTPLPDVEGLRRLLQSLAMLDAIVCESWEGRYYSFNMRWGKRQMLRSMRNGSGDEFYAVFTPAGCLVKGFAHEVPMSPYRRTPPAVAPGVLDGLPAEFAPLLNEPALDLESTTFCIWRKHDDQQWQRGNIRFPEERDPDGSQQLLALLDGNPESYARWADEYYEDLWDDGRQLQLSDVTKIYRHDPLTSDMVAALNPERRFDELRKEADEIGYPLA